MFAGRPHPAEPRALAWAGVDPGSLGSVRGMAGRAGGDGDPWWKAGVLYQIYPRSFADSNADGVGDVRGVIGKLDYLQWLGVDGIWLSPITRSPNLDWGYDVSDYRAVQPDLGTDADVDELIADAGRRGIRVLLDFVPNHSSDQHPWFVESRSSRDARRRDWYVWADPAPDGSPPNNWVSGFGGPAWTLDPATGQYYMHNHLASQPDLNWWNEEVRDEFDAILRYWFDRGVAGFRIDVCNIIIKDALLRDNPPATAEDSAEAQLFGQRSVYNMNRPEAHDVIKRWRAIADSYDPPRVLVGETPVEELEKLVAFHGDNDELHLAFNFGFIGAPLEAEAMRGIVEAMERLLPADAWPAWTGSNHDMFHLATRWAHDEPRRIRAALVVLLGLRGTPVLYQGDEIGQGDTVVEPPDLRDPLGVNYWPAYAGRDAGRTPMQWRDAPGAGFTAPDAKPWLPIGDTTRANVEHQRDDPASLLSLTRALIARRRESADLHAGAYESVTAPDGVWAWRRGAHTLVVCNLQDAEVTLAGFDGTVLVATDHTRVGDTVAATLRLGPWEAVIVGAERATGS
jgi:alpha-glucosidase